MMDTRIGDSEGSIVEVEEIGDEEHKRKQAYKAEMRKSENAKVFRLSYERL